MAAMKPILDIAAGASVVLLVAFVLWAVAQSVIVRRRLKRNCGLQLRLLRVGLVLVILSPLLSLGAIFASQSLWSGAPITISDMAVASYLRGKIAMPAVEFEALLNSRNRVFEMILSGGPPWMTAALAGMILFAIALAAQTVWRITQVRQTVNDAHLAPHRDHRCAPFRHSARVLCSPRALAPPRGIAFASSDPTGDTADRACA